MVVSPTEKKSRCIKHWSILKEQGLPALGNPFFSKTLGTPFKNKISSEDLPRYKELISFQATHRFFTVRQFYYHLIQSKDSSIRLGANDTKESRKSYNKSKRIVNRSRLGSMIPFDSVIDDTDLLGTTQQSCTIEEFLKTKSESYRSNWFENQNCYVEVWLEKRALEGVVSPVTDKYGVYLSCSGKNPTWSQVGSAIERFKAKGKVLNYILYLGDLDPQGKEMVKWLQKEAFKVLEFDHVFIEPLALNLEHANDSTLSLHRIHSLKGRDSVKKWYKANHCDYTIELDALDPTTLKNIVEKGILNKLEVKEINRKQQEDKVSIGRMRNYLSQIP